MKPDSQILAPQDARTSHSHLLRILQRACLYLFWPAIAVVVWGELKPGAGIAGMSDKLQHFIAYGGLAGLAIFATGGRRRAVWIVAALILLGGVLEILQGFTGRDPSFGDEAANSLGAISGAIIAIRLFEILGRGVPLQKSGQPRESANR